MNNCHYMGTISHHPSSISPCKSTGWTARNTKIRGELRFNRSPSPRTYQPGLTGEPWRIGAGSGSGKATSAGVVSLRSGRRTVQPKVSSVNQFERIPGVAAVHGVHSVEPPRPERRLTGEIGRLGHASGGAIRARKFCLGSKNQPSSIILPTGNNSPSVFSRFPRGRATECAVRAALPGSPETGCRGLRWGTGTDRRRAAHRHGRQE